MSQANQPASTAPPPIPVIPPAAAAPILGYVSMAGDDIPPLTIENIHLLQEAATYRVGERQLRRSGIGDIVWGIICVLIGIPAFQVNPVNAVMVLIGAMLVGVGIWIIARPRPIGSLIDGIALLLVAAWNTVITALNLAATASGKQPDTPRLGVLIIILQYVWGVQRLQRYPRFAASEAMKPSPKISKWLDELVKSLKDARMGSDSSIIAFTIKGFNGQQNWRARLLPEMAIFMRDNGQDMILLTREDATISLKEARRSKGQTKVYFELGHVKSDGFIGPESLSRFEAWNSEQIPIATALSASPITPTSTSPSD